MRDFLERPLGAKLIIVLSAAFLIEMLGAVDSRVRGDGRRRSQKCGWTTGYEGSNFALVRGVASRWRSSSGSSFPSSGRDSRCADGQRRSITAILGVALALCALVKVIEDNEFQTGWAWIGLAIALAVMMIALIRVRYRWGKRDDEPTPPSAMPRAAPPGSDPRGSAARPVARQRKSLRCVDPRLSYGSTYGGDQVSTWSVLRSSSEPRSPVGLVKQPAQTQVRRTISHSPPSQH